MTNKRGYPSDAMMLEAGRAAWDWAEDTNECHFCAMLNDDDEFGHADECPLFGAVVRAHDAAAAALTKRAAQGRSLTESAKAEIAGPPFGKPAPPVTPAGTPGVVALCSCGRAACELQGRSAAHAACPPVTHAPAPKGHKPCANPLHMHMFANGPKCEPAAPAPAVVPATAWPSWCANPTHAHRPHIDNGECKAPAPTSPVVAPPPAIAPVPGGTGAFEAWWGNEAWRIDSRDVSAFARAAFAAGQATHDASAEGVLLARAMTLLAWANEAMQDEPDGWGDNEAGYEALLADARALAAAVPGAVAK